LPLIETSGATIRVIAGSAFGAVSRVTTHSPMFYAHIELAPATRIELPHDYSERAVYVVNGEIETDGNIYGQGHLLVFRSGGDAVVKAAEQTTLLGLGGEPLGPRFIEWNFVASSQKRIEEAKADWRAGRFKLPDSDNKEFIPLPPDPPPPANPIS
jgi:hypothetical protein